MKHSENKSAIGIVAVDKPAGWTSHDVVAKLRRLYHTKQVGHTGTLDPMATGLLPVCVGKATKLVEYIARDRKTYLAKAVSGIRTDTGDTTGIVYAKSDLPVADDLAEILASFVGEQDQIPPMYSALKYKGKKLYEYARMGICVPRVPRRICVYDLECIDGAADAITLRASVSSGTYIRTLIDDIGVEASCYFTMAGLRRESVGKLHVEEAHTLDAIEAMSEAEREALLLPMDRMLGHLPAAEFPASQRLALSQGKSFESPYVEEGENTFRVYTDGEFLGLGEVRTKDGRREFKMKKVLC